MGGEMNLVVVVGGEEAGPKTGITSGGGVWSKVFKNALSFIKGLKSGRNRQAASSSSTGISSGSSSDEEGLKNPIMEVMEKLELSKAVFMLGVPMTTGLILKSDTLSPAVVHSTLVATVVGITATWNGMLLSRRCPKCGSVVEQVGMSSIFLGFNILVWAYLPPELRFFPVICWGFSLLPFAMAAISPTNQQGMKEEDAACPV